MFSDYFRLLNDFKIIQILFAETDLLKIGKIWNLKEDHCAIHPALSVRFILKIDAEILISMLFQK